MKLRLTDCVERNEALAAGKRFYMPPMPCRNGHKSVRYVVGGICLACSKERADRDNGIEVSDPGNGIPTRVYVFSTQGFVKIGLAETVWTRLSVTRTHCPLPVELAYQSAVMSRWLARTAERECHRLLEPFNTQGEWFKISAADAVPIVEKIAGAHQIIDKPPPIENFDLFNEPADAGFFSPSGIT